jgi:hypothetical protein
MRITDTGNNATMNIELKAEEIEEAIIQHILRNHSELGLTYDDLAVCFQYAEIAPNNTSYSTHSTKDLTIEIKSVRRETTSILKRLQNNQEISDRLQSLFTEVTWDILKFRRFKKAYNRTVKAKKESFTFKDGSKKYKFLTTYAAYLIEYLEQRLPDVNYNAISIIKVSESKD